MTEISDSTSDNSKEKSDTPNPGIASQNPSKENREKEQHKIILIFHQLKSAINSQNIILEQIKENSIGAHSYSYDSYNDCAKETTLNAFKEGLNAKVESANDAIKKTNSNVKKILDNELVIKPNLTFIIVWCIGGFLLIGFFLALFVTSKQSFDKLTLDKKLANQEQNATKEEQNNNITNTLQSSEISRILHQEFSSGTFKIPEELITKIKNSTKDALKEGFTLLTKQNPMEDPQKIREGIKKEIESLIKNQNELEELRKYKTANEPILNGKNKEIEKLKGIEKDLDDLKNSLNINKSTLIVFTASNDLLFTADLAEQMNNFFKNEVESRKKGFKRAFSLLVERKLSQLVEFNKEYKAVKIEKEIADKHSVKINDDEILKEINRVSKESGTINKEILIIVSSQASAPNPETIVFKENNQTVNFVIVVTPNANIIKSKYDNWGKWASNNNAKVTWIYDDKNNDAKIQIKELIKKAMGKDMGF